MLTSVASMDASVGPEAQQLAQAFLESVPRAMRLVRTEMRAVAKTEMTVPQFRILAHLARTPRSSGELADALGISPPNLTRLSLGLIQRQLLTSTRDTQDRRRVLLRLTPKGRARYQALRSGAAKRLEARFADLPAATRIALQNGFEALRSLQSPDFDGPSAGRGSQS